MSYCSIRWCGKNTRSSNYKTDGITFHRFPKNPGFKEKWIKLTKRENWLPLNHSVVCSRHFTKDCFIIMKNQRRLLLTAVPTLSLPKMVDDDTSEPELSNLYSVCLAPSPPASPMTSQIKIEVDPLEIPSSQFCSPIEIHTVDKNRKQSITENKNINVSPSLVSSSRYSQSLAASAVSSTPISIEIMDAIQLETPSQLNAQQVKRQLIRRVIKLSKKIVQKNKQTKNLREAVRYYKNKVASLNVIIKELEVENMIDSQKTKHNKKNSITSQVNRKKEENQKANVIRNIGITSQVIPIKKEENYE